MFVEFMTFDEIRKELHRDKEYLSLKILNEAQKLKKYMRQYNVSFLNKFRDYVSPRKNRWLLHFKYNKKTDPEMGIDVWCHYPVQKGYRVICYDVNKDHILYYKGHFFTRYFQRGNYVPVDSPIE